MKRRVFLSVLVVALMGSFAFAAEGDKPKEGKEGKGKGRGDAMAAALEKANLNDDQKAQVKKIQEEFKASMDAARETKDRDAMRAAVEKRHEAIMGVLTAEQKETVKKHLEENRPKRGDGDKKKKPE